MNSGDEQEFCKEKGLKLVTIDELCPDGPGNPPVGGAIRKAHWVRVDDDIEQWVQLGTNDVYGNRLCKGYIQLYADEGNPRWGEAGKRKEDWFNDQVFCSTPTAAPTPNPTPVPTTAPSPKATLSMEDAAGDGCKNNIKFSSSFVSSSGNQCKACSLCEESRLSAIFDPSSQGICIDCDGIEDRCDEFEVLTTFDNEWAVKYISLSSSHAGSEYDPKTITMEGSNEDDVWHQLSHETLEFKERKEAVDYPFDGGLKKYKKYKMTFSMKDNTLKMYIGHYAIISSYTKTCTSNIFEDITGKYVMPYKISI